MLKLSHEFSPLVRADHLTAVRLWNRRSVCVARCLALYRAGWLDPVPDVNSTPLDLELHSAMRTLYAHELRRANNFTSELHAHYLTLTPE